MEHSGRISQERMEITFHGKGIKEGKINARILGSTLTAASDLMQALANLEEYGDHPAPELKVGASEEGSFELELILEAVGEWWAATRTILTGPDVAATVNLAGLAGMAIGVLKFFKDKGRARATNAELEPDGQMAVELEAGTTVHAPPEVVAAAANPRVQTSAKRMVEATQFPGVEWMEIHAETVNVNVVVNSTEAQDFPEPDDEPPTKPTIEYEAWAAFQRPDFGGTRWTVSTTRGTKQMTIEDQEFLRRVDDGSVSLNKYSEFRVTVREEPYTSTSGQTRYRRSVTRVQESRDGTEASQALPDESGDGEL